ncbi:hypothetical protein vBSenM1_29 [Salmonella phage vB_SenM-1]|uniref:Uncharacterized protein n=1 Tax=Salmonella phage vB_SenM-1 TaxID=2732255 RepID=A0A6M4BEL3_9CAUD|nr:hypothetical protein vBSenM1_29 [Salmonella phage vB_SenM-1]
MSLLISEPDEKIYAGGKNKKVGLLNKFVDVYTVK